MRISKLYSSIGLLALGMGSMAQITPTQSENYIFIQEPTAKTTDMANIDNDSIIQAIQYFDGLGRPKQSILVKGATNQKDIVTLIEYDGFGRQEVDFLPVPVNQQNGQFVDPSGINGNYYQLNYGESVWYSQKSFEDSPLNRVMKQAAPGEDWAKDSGHEIEFAYQTNKMNDVWLYWINPSGNIQKGAHPFGHYYAPNTLYKTIITDENGNKIEEFKDKQGRVVLKRAYVSEQDEAGRPGPGILNPVQRVDTYYVYDIYGNLTAVIPPLAAKNSSITLTIQNNLCYLYRYDEKNRLVEKKLPGKGKEYMVYDKQDRLVATQDANLRSENKWLFTKYDKFGRVVYTGTLNSSSTRQSLQDQVNDFGSNNEERKESVQFTKSGMQVYYTTTAFPMVFGELLSVNY